MLIFVGMTGYVYNPDVVRFVLRRWKWVDLRQFDFFFLRVFVHTAIHVRLGLVERFVDHQIVLCTTHAEPLPVDDSNLEY